MSFSLPISLRRTCNLLLLCCIVVPSSLLAQPFWGEAFPCQNPTHRSYPAAAFDAARQEVVLFGGFDHQARSDTLIWDGAQWSKRELTISPPARLKHQLVYDSARGVVVLFGGQNDGVLLNDTWEWDGSHWVERTSAVSPSPRDSFGLAYDTARGVTVLYGGFAGAGGQSLDDTWEWDGVSWERRSPVASPPGRNSPMMAYDVNQGVTVLFGGFNQGRLGDTWTWNGSAWTELSLSRSPPARNFGNLVFDPSRGRLLLFGGLLNGSTYLNDTWEFTFIGWSEVTYGTPPSPRCCVGLAFDGVNNDLLLYGGSGGGGTLSKLGGTHLFSTSFTRPACDGDGTRFDLAVTPAPAPTPTTAPTSNPEDPALEAGVTPTPTPTPAPTLTPIPTPTPVPTSTEPPSLIPGWTQAPELSPTPTLTPEMHVGSGSEGKGGNTAGGTGYGEDSTTPTPTPTPVTPPAPQPTADGSELPNENGSGQGADGSTEGSSSRGDSGGDGTVAGEKEDASSPEAADDDPQPAILQGQVLTPDGPLEGVFINADRIGSTSSDNRGMFTLNLATDSEAASRPIVTLSRSGYLLTPSSIAVSEVTLREFTVKAEPEFISTLGCSEALEATRKVQIENLLGTIKAQLTSLYGAAAFVGKGKVFLKPWSRAEASLKEVREENRRVPEAFFQCEEALLCVTINNATSTRRTQRLLKKFRRRSSAFLRRLRKRRILKKRNFRSLSRTLRQDQREVRRLVRGYPRSTSFCSTTR